MNREAIKQRAGKNKDVLLDYLKLETVAAQNRDIEGTAEYVKQMLEQLGGEARILDDFPGSPVVYGYFQAGPSANSNRTLLYYNHYDVQPEDPIDEWKTKPFEPVVKDGRLFARGVSDNKGDLVARLNAIEYFQENGGLPVNVKFLIEGDEETGSPHVYDYLEKYAALFEADACIWESGGKNAQEQYVISTGVKGNAYFDFYVQSADVDAHSSKGAVYDNAAWRLVQAFASMRTADNQITIEGFYEPMIEPTEEERRLVNALPFDGEEEREIFGLKHPYITDDLEVTPQEALILYPTLTINGIETGYNGVGAKTVLPRAAKGKLDVRLVPGYTPEIVRDILRKHLDSHGFTDVEMTLIGAADPHRTDADETIVQIVRESAEEIYGDALLELNSPGTGPMAGFSKYLNVPIVGSGCTNAKSYAHGPNENIRLDDYYQEISHQINILTKFGE